MLHIMDVVGDKSDVWLSGGKSALLFKMLSYSFKKQRILTLYPFLIKIFYKVDFDHVLSHSFPNSLILHTPYPPNFMFYLSKEKKVL